LKRPIVTALFLIPFVLSAGYLETAAVHPWLNLLITGIWVGIPAAVALFFVALPRDITREIIFRLQQFSFLAKR
jgi:hypothetical protein